MFQISILILAFVTLAGCAATRQEVAQSLGDKYLGKSVDTLVSEFGPPANTFKMNSGETAYVWQLSAVTNIDTDRGSGTAQTHFCRVNVVAAPNGIVNKVTTEDASNILGESLCAKRLGMRRN